VLCLAITYRARLDVAAIGAARACACGKAAFSGMASTADYKRQDFKESACLDLLSGLRSYRHREI